MTRCHALFSEIRNTYRFRAQRCAAGARKLSSDYRCSPHNRQRPFGSHPDKGVRSRRSRLHQRGRRFHLLCVALQPGLAAGITIFLSRRPVSEACFRRRLCGRQPCRGKSNCPLSEPNFRVYARSFEPGRKTAEAGLKDGRTMTS